MTADVSLVSFFLVQAYGGGAPEATPPDELSMTELDAQLLFSALDEGPRWGEGEFDDLRRLVTVEELLPVAEKVADAQLFVRKKSPPLELEGDELSSLFREPEGAALGSGFEEILLTDDVDARKLGA